MDLTVVDFPLLLCSLDTACYFTTATTNGCLLR
jgi:hypothetical protein